MPHEFGDENVEKSGNGMEKLLEYIAGFGRYGKRKS